jgi:FKBP-type peptidyl-prolyl cis-trans isomerase
MFSRLLLLLLVPLFVLGCSSSPTDTPGKPREIPAPPDVEAPPADAQRTASGLASKVLTPGSGTRHPRPNSRVRVHYTGWLKSGKMFETTTGSQPAEFGLDEVVRGWTEGVQMMVEGETRRFWIPAKLAYGDTGEVSGPLVFDIELVKILS